MDRGTIVEYVDEISGTLISKEGDIITGYQKAKQMVDSPHRYRAIVCTNSGEMDVENCEFEAKVISADVRAELVHLQVDVIWETSQDNASHGKVFKLHYDGVQKEKFSFPAYVTSLGKSPKGGDRVYILGYAKNKKKLPSFGVKMIETVISEEKQWGYTVQDPLPKGFPGGSVYSEEGEYIGMVTIAGANKIGEFLGTKFLDTYFIRKGLDIDLAGTYSVSCHDPNSQKREDDSCFCKAGFVWENRIGKCIEDELSQYCGENAYQSEDTCKCREGYTRKEDNTLEKMACVPILEEVSSEPEEDLSSKNKTTPYFWKQLRFLTIGDLKIFAKKLKNNKMLLLWNHSEKKKIKDCHLSFQESPEKKAKIIFQRKNIALVVAEEDKQYSVHISGCLSDKTETPSESQFLMELKK